MIIPSYSPLRTGIPMVDRNLDAIKAAISPVTNYLASLSSCAASAFCSNAATLTGGANVVIPFNGTNYDTDGAVTTGAAARFTCPSKKGGIYHLCAAANASGAIGELILMFWLNGAERHRVREAVDPATNNTGICISCDEKLSPGDYVDVRVLVTNNASLQNGDPGQENFFHVHRVLGY